MSFFNFLLLYYVCCSIFNGIVLSFKKIINNVYISFVDKEKFWSLFQEVACHVVSDSCHALFGSLDHISLDSLYVEKMLPIIYP